MSTMVRKIIERILNARARSYERETVNDARELLAFYSAGTIAIVSAVPGFQRRRMECELRALDDRLGDPDCRDPSGIALLAIAYIRRGLWATSLRIEGQDPHRVWSHLTQRWFCAEYGDVTTPDFFDEISPAAWFDPPLVIDSAYTREMRARAAREEELCLQA